MARILRSPAERAKVLEDFKISGMSASAFAQQQGVPKGTLYSWLAQAKQRLSPLRVAKVIRKSALRLAAPTDAMITLEKGALRILVSAGFDPQTPPVKATGAVLGGRPHPYLQCSC